jgi:hypothetical protein
MMVVPTARSRDFGAYLSDSAAIVATLSTLDSAFFDLRRRALAGEL